MSDERAPSESAASTVSDVASPAAALPDGATLSARKRAIADALALHPTDEARQQLKQEIITLFRDADAAVAAFAAFKDDVKGLAESWKQLDGRTSPNGHPASSSRVDHLGASTFVEKGWSKLSVGDAAGAEVALRRALDLAPGNSEAETLLGWAQMLQEQYDSALLTFHNVLMRDPQNTLARTNVGFICLRKKSYGQAIEHLSRAIRIDNDRKATLYAHLYLGMVYREREMYADAELFFRKAIELGPNLIQAWYELGRARWFAGDRDGARESWRAGADANKFNAWGKRCAETLEQVERGGAPPKDG